MGKKDVLHPFQDSNKGVGSINSAHPILSYAEAYMHTTLEQILHSSTSILCSYSSNTFLHVTFHSVYNRSV
jgi:hypothetical protein